LPFRAGCQPEIVQIQPEKENHVLLVGIRTKLAFITFLLVTIVILVSSVIVMGIMDTFLLGELVKRGLSMSRGAANAAGYSILALDRLSLDNLVAKIRDRQEDINYAAVVDRHGTIITHSDIGKTGTRFVPAAGEVVSTAPDGSRVSRANSDGHASYEFSTPIMFASKEIGNFYMAIDAAVLASAQVAARRKVALASTVILFLAVAGTYYIARFFTTPIKQLTDGVSLLKSGSYQGEIRVTQRDELGELTKNFNDMAHVILNQQEKLEEYARGLEESYFSTVKILATSIDARDDYTLQHSTRVAALSLLVGEEMGLGSEQQRELEVAALVHDLGKIRIPDQILKKAGPLDNDEIQLVKRHPRDGAEILGHSRALRRFIPAVLYHHEWHNGKGYPEGIKGDDIPLFASIIALADAYDAMTSSRPYRAGLPAEMAVQEIIRYRGSQFHPHLADLFVASLARWDNTQQLTVIGVPMLEGSLQRVPS
jgi:HD-GYP domain-containing protein (c-di-GMP phosphodiesterase class II)